MNIGKANAGLRAAIARDPRMGFSARDTGIDRVGKRYGASAR